MGIVFADVESNLTVVNFEKKNVCYFTTDLSQRLC